jgi:hypothetical protein
VASCATTTPRRGCALSPTDRRARAQRGEGGQATTETILLVWIMVVFFASMYQIFLVNHTIYRSLAATQQQLFEAAFPHNCLDSGDTSIFSSADAPRLLNELMRLLGLPPSSGSATFCRYQRDPEAHAVVDWTAQDFPETQVQVVGLLRRFGLPEPLFLESRRLQMGAGPDGPGDGFGHFQGLARFFAKPLFLAEWAAINAGNIPQWELERVGLP